ncbi:hypothetical protein ScPMuIL_001305 [Solemya velum]
MAQKKRAWKLQEFVAHAANVNCLAMGHKSGRVMVTGGEDRKVNLWAVGKPNCIMSLTGHTTPVESVRFGHAEEMVVAGSLSGALKVWDLEQAKIMRTLTGHKSSIRSLDFHPYGDYAASGSLDCNIKLWDIRRKGCIYTYKSHTNGINCLRFSPDGRWIASAGEDGLVKLWDLTAGKLLADLKLHTGPVNVVEFHPNELLLASGSSDKTIKFWDLENFNNVSSTEGDSVPVRSIYFHSDGTCLFSGGNNILKVYSWEPSQCYDTVPLAWGEVSDIAIAQNQLIGASTHQTNVCVYVVDLQRVQPFGKVPHEDGNCQSSHSSSGRRSFITERPPTQCSRQASVPKEDQNETTSSSPDDDRESLADIKNPADYNEIFRPKSTLSHSPPRNVEPFLPPDEGMYSSSNNISKLSRCTSNEPEPVRGPVTKSQNNPPQISKQAANHQPASPTNSQQASKPPAVQKALHKPPKPQNTPQATKTYVESSKPSAVQKPPMRGPSNPETPDVSANDFLPKHIGSGDDRKRLQNVSEADILSSLTKGHSAMLTVMSGRSRNIQIVRAMWTSGNTKTAIDSAISMNDPAVMVDVLNILNSKQALWNLDICSILLSQLGDLLNSKYESYVLTSCSSLKILLKTFGPVIKSNMESVPSIGVDISREERAKKCNMCYIQLGAIRETVAKRHSVPGKLGNVYRELNLLMQTLD